MSLIPRLKIVGLISMGLCVATGAYAGNITYTLDIPTVGDLTVAGTITSDGNTGPLTVADIVSFDFSETSSSIPYTALFSPSDVDSSGFAMFGVGADATGLYIDSSADGGGYLSVEVTEGAGQYSYVNPIVLPGDGIGHYSDCTVSCLEEAVTDDGDVTVDASHLVNPYDGTGPTYFATNGVAASTPEPETYALMLAALLVIACYRTRKRFLRS
jgi:hypothetical protein